MALRITDDRIVSDLCPQVAQRGLCGRWTVTGCTGTYGRNQAITAMTLAEIRAQGLEDEYGPHIQGWEAELER